MHNIDFVSLIARWIHVLSFIVAVGGAIFMRLVLTPAAKESLSDEAQQSLRTAVTRRWRTFVHAAVGLLLLSGGYNFYVAHFVDHVTPMPYHAIFGVKLILALAVFVLAIGLSSDKAWSAALRTDRPKWLGVLVALGVLVVMLSGLLKQTHVPKAELHPTQNASVPDR